MTTIRPEGNPSIPLLDGRTRPDGLPPPLAVPTVLSAYKRLASGPAIGLGVNAGLTATVLRQIGVQADAVAVGGADELRELLQVLPAVNLVVLEGLWFDGPTLEKLAGDFPRVTFVPRCHSQIAFLQIEPTTIAAMRETLEVSRRLANIRLAGNSPRLVDWAREAWGGDCWLLPNLYNLPPLAERPPSDASAPLRLASFGAARLQKHHSVAAAAAVLVARRLGREVEFYLNCGRETPGGGSVPGSLRQLLASIPGVRLVESPWQPAPDFRRLIASMDCCFQLSASETFNLVTADAAAAGVPSVVGEAIDWAPWGWTARIDDPSHAADVAMRILADETAGERGREALEDYCRGATAVWRQRVASLA